MNQENLFEEYLGDEDPGGAARFFKTPRGLLTLFSILLGIVVTVIFINTVIFGTMSAEEVRESIDITWHETHWVDKQITPQETKIVPSIRLKIRNSGKRPLQYLDIQAVFVFEETGDTLGDGMIRLFKEPLQPGETSPEISIKSLFGYSASSKAKFIQNKKEWKKVQAKLFARAKGSSLVRIGEIIPVKQEIEGYDPSTDYCSPFGGIPVLCFEVS